MGAREHRADWGSPQRGGWAYSSALISYLPREPGSLQLPLAVSSLSPGVGVGEGETGTRAPG